jgi:hypothetical protein
MSDNRFDDLRSLPVRDVSPASAERVRRLAMHAMSSPRPWWALPVRVATPVLLAGTVGIYLTWAVRVAISVCN